MDTTWCVLGIGNIGRYIGEGGILWCAGAGASWGITRWSFFDRGSLVWFGLGYWLLMTNAYKAELSRYVVMTEKGLRVLDVTSLCFSPPPGPKVLFSAFETDTQAPPPWPPPLPPCFVLDSSAVVALANYYLCSILSNIHVCM